jgi:peptidoglycan-N-acetylglucosamine deacetylase
MQPDGYVTFSVDDGHPLDFRTAELLQKYGLKATFYIPAKNPERTVMPESGIKEMSRTFEIGAHTLNHLRLPALSKPDAYAEIHNGKKWLEDLLGNPVTSFCYPGGKFNGDIMAMVQEAGFLGARTCMLNLTEFPDNPFVWGVSTHACPYRPVVQFRHALLEKNLSGAWNFAALYKGTTDWVQHFIMSLKHVSKHGGIAHLYLHSWEIDKLQDWARLEKAFTTVAEMQSLRRVTNGDLFALSRPPQP